MAKVILSVDDFGAHHACAPEILIAINSGSEPAIAGRFGASGIKKHIDFLQLLPQGKTPGVDCGFVPTSGKLFTRRELNGCCHPREAFLSFPDNQKNAPGSFERSAGSVKLDRSARLVLSSRIKCLFQRN